jgi:glycosyltransferase involved in cell wall biosynthesis
VSLRIVLNTRSDDASAWPGIYGLGERLRAIDVDATVNDWGDYGRYDVAVFLGYDHELDAAREQNPAIRVALVDPKLSRPEWADAARRADFLAVSSIEQRDAFLRVNPNVVVYFLVPPVETAPRRHKNTDPLVIGYHGNRVHLETMVDRVRPALEALARTRPVELHAVYNHEVLGRANIGMPESGVTVRHIQWTEQFVDDLRRADIGIVPNELPIRDRARVLQDSAYDEPQFAYEALDYLVRFKLSSNPGRIYPFALLEIPVVVDFTPSSSQLVLDGVSGYVASSAHGWLAAFEQLAASAELRASMGAELHARATAEHERQLRQFVEWCTRPLVSAHSTLAEAAGLEEDLALMDRYSPPTAPWTWRRIRARLRRR